VSFLNYRGGEGYYDVELPSRVFAFVDRVEPEFALLDSLDADWLERNRRTPWLGASEVSDDVERRLSALEVPTGALGKLQECDWLEVHLDDGAGDVRVDQYFNLFAAPLERRARSMKPTSPELTALLTRVSGLDAIGDASDEDVISGLGRLEHERVSAAAVYDVGQGGCNAVISDVGFPLLYFDLGGGVQANRGTYALRDRAFCFTEDPPVVLSHWDWDHWSSAQRDDQRAHDVTWIAPRQPLGPANARFAGKLKHLLLWPGHEPLPVGPVLLERCSGASSNRNESGIAMLLHDPDGDGRMLFPGDAGYASVPSATGAFTSVVLPHHGGATAGGTVVDPDGSVHGRLVCSAGPCNSYGHPSPSVMRAHKAWTQRRCTMDRRIDGLGHVHLYWSDMTPDVVIPCGGSNCQLGSHQR